MLETFEERVATKGGTIDLLSIRTLLSPHDLWIPTTGWALLDTEQTGSGILVGFDPEHIVDSFTPNVTAVLWYVTANVTDASQLTSRITTRIENADFELLSTSNGAIPVEYTGAAQWFHDEFRISATGLEVHAYARLDVFACSTASYVFHALQRSHAAPRGSDRPVPTLQQVNMSEFCRMRCFDTIENAGQASI